MSRPFFDRVSDYRNDPFFPTHPVLAFILALRDVIFGEPR